MGIFNWVLRKQKWMKHSLTKVPSGWRYKTPMVNFQEVLSDPKGGGPIQAFGQRWQIRDNT